MQLLSRDLETYDLPDIDRALEIIGGRERADGEPLRPALATMVAEIKRVKLARLDAGNKAVAEAERIAFNKRKAEHPEEFEISPDTKDAIRRMDLKYLQPRVQIVRPDPPPATVLTCNDCGARMATTVGLHLASSELLREMIPLAEAREARESAAEVARAAFAATEALSSDAVRAKTKERLATGLCIACGEPSPFTQCLPCTQAKVEQAKARASKSAPKDNQSDEDAA